MTMTASGLAKLHEEIGELLQETGKKLAYFHTQEHPDAAGPLDARMQREMADVYAALDFVRVEFALAAAAIEERRMSKLALFEGSPRLKMTASGLAMLHQKMGALLVVTGQALDLFDGNDRPSGDPLENSMCQAIADLYAALDYVKFRFGLSDSVIEARRLAKLSLFEEWQADPANGSDCFHAHRSSTASP